MEWQLSQDPSIAQFGDGQIVARSSDGVICTFSFSAPPAVLEAGQTYQLSLQGLSTSHPGRPHRVINVTIHADMELRSIQNPNHYRVPSNRSVYVYPPPFREDMVPNAGAGPINAAHSEVVAFEFRPENWNSKEFNLFYVFVQFVIRINN